MIQTSDAYKEMMEKPMRNRGYVSISLGVVNQNAQGNAGIDSNTSRKYYSKGNLFDDSKNGTTYGTLEQNFSKADGTFKFVPRETPNIVLQDNGLVVPIGESLTINFDTAYSIKGFTIDFVETSFPTDFTIVTDEENISISNNTEYLFTTDDVLGSTTSITITPTAMSGGTQCMHIKRLVMGVGLTFSNSIVESAELESFVSGISIETSYKELSVSAFDNYAQFDVDNEDAFINFLQSGQDVNISFGVDLDDGTQEWFQVASCKLKDWSAKKGRISFHATDLLSRTEETYSHMVLTSRTAKSEFEAIFSAMGLTANDYVIDNYFASVNITNPIEENTYRDCLQLLANATRGIVYEDEHGIVHVAKNFDRQVQASVVESGVNYRYFTEETDESENVIHVSDNAQYDGTFRTRNEQSVFDDEDTFYNSVEILNVTNAGYIPQIEVVDNQLIFTFDDEHTSSSPVIDIVIRCDRSNPYFPIDEDGWYYLCYKTSDNRPRFSHKDTDVVKIGDTLIPIERIENSGANYDWKAFNFYVDGINSISGDLFFHVKINPTVTKSSNTVRFCICKGKKDYSWQGLYAGYVSYYSVVHNPYIFFNTIHGKYLIQFDAPHPLHATLTDGGIVKDIEINSDLFSVEVPHSVSTLTFTKTQPYAKIVMKKFLQIASGNYIMPLAQTKEHPYASIDEKIKDIKVRIITYQDNGGEIERVDDEVYYTEAIDATGVTKTLENPLISTSAQAELVAKWLKAYYIKNITYDIEYRGEPALQSNDMIYLENEFTTLNPIDAQNVKLTYNGAFGGRIEARKALIVES